MALAPPALFVFVWSDLQRSLGMEGAALIVIVTQLVLIVFLTDPISDFLTRNFALTQGETLFSCDEFFVKASPECGFVVREWYSDRMKVPNSELKRLADEAMIEIGRISFTQDECSDACEVLFERVGRACIWPFLTESKKTLQSSAEQLAISCWKEGNRRAGC